MMTRGFDYALSIVTKPTPAQAWLASVKVLEPDHPDDPEPWERERCRVCGEWDCEEHEPPERCTICRLEDCEGCLVECDLDSYKRYRDAYGDDPVL